MERYILYSWLKLTFTSRLYWTIRLKVYSVLLIFLTKFMGYFCPWPILIWLNSLMSVVSVLWQKAHCYTLLDKSKKVRKGIKISFRLWRCQRIFQFKWYVNAHILTEASDLLLKGKSFFLNSKNGTPYIPGTAYSATHRKVMASYLYWVRKCSSSTIHGWTFWDDNLFRRFCHIITYFKEKFPRNCCNIKQQLWGECKSLVS